MHKVKFIKRVPDAKMPEYAKQGDSGADLFSVEDVFIPIGKHALIDTGISVQLPPGYEAQIRSRSGLALRGVQVANGIGTCDNAYRGPYKTILYNFNCKEKSRLNGPNVEHGILIKKGDKIAQMVIMPVQQFIFEQVEELDKTERGEGGFGSSGR